ncbi:uncharacterized protein TNCV_2910101 [Trichonephila clavipes]|nr:uncharacterized protein TNCV_2910101 [Trichonephila clavipes]
MEWRYVVFSDDSRFCLGASDSRVLVRGKPGGLLQPNCLLPRHTGPIPGVMGEFSNKITFAFLPPLKRNVLYRVLAYYLGLRDHLSSIGHVWDIIERQLQHHPQPALTVTVLTQQVQQEWNFIPQSDI